MEAISGSRADKRVELIRDLCTGEGVTEAVYASRIDEIKAAFGDYDLDTLEELFDQTMETMPDSPYKDALVNAWRPAGGMNLTERRTDYAERIGSVSTRTLIRHEQEGAELFVKFYDIVEGQYRRLKEEEESDDAARDADIEVLRRRVNDLEQLVLILMGSVGSINATITEQIEGKGDGSQYRLPMETWFDQHNDMFYELVRKMAGRHQGLVEDLPID